MSQRALTVPRSDTPPGSGMEYWGDTLPEGGWIWADGNYYDPSEYPKLFEAIKYIHGRLGNKFKVPDKRSRTSVGAGKAGELTQRNLGDTFGEENVSLKLSEMPAHEHDAIVEDHNHLLFDQQHSHGVLNAVHTHSLYANTYDGSDGAREKTDSFYTRGNVAITGEDSGSKGYITHNVSGTQLLSSENLNISLYASPSNISIQSAKSVVSIRSKGSGQAHNNCQPSIVCNYIIKI